jgi:hypothetical protein
MGSQSGSRHTRVERGIYPQDLILDLGLDVAQVSRILGHASITVTLDVYTHLFDEARHTREIPYAHGLKPVCRVARLQSPARHLPKSCTLHLHMDEPDVRRSRAVA